MKVLSYVKFKKYLSQLKNSKSSRKRKKAEFIIKQDYLYFNRKQNSISK